MHQTATRITQAWVAWEGNDGATWTIRDTVVCHTCTRYQATLGQRSMTDFVVVSSDLRTYVFDAQRKGVKRWAELSTDHHLMVSWIHWQGRMPAGPRKPKWIVKVNREHLSEAPVCELFNSYLQENFSHLLGKFGLASRMFWQLILFVRKG